MLTQQRFSELTKSVIDNFEGGYFHPNMLKNFKPSDQEKLKYSGETMFGLDRMAGAALAKYPEWAIFWAAVDASKKANPLEWRYNAKNVPGADKLKELAGNIMYQWFNELARKYILVGSMDEIANDNRLIIHFSYAAWNGPGWFERYSNALNQAIKKYEGNKEAIFTEAFKERLFACKYIKVGGKWVKTVIPNKIIRQQGANMMALFKKMGLVK